MGLDQDIQPVPMRRDVAEVVGGLRATFASGRTRPAEWRMAQLRGIERFVVEREDEIADALAADLGRSAFEAWLLDMSPVRIEAAYVRARLRRWMRRSMRPMPSALMPALGWVQYEPVGVVLVIGAWNAPMTLALWPLIDAVAAGNCVVLKPSELAPATSRLLARRLPEYVDPDAVVVVEGDGSATQRVLAEGVDHCLYTGGTEVGRKVMAAAAPQLTPVTLEMGGKSPAIVAADAELDVTARRIVWAKLLNAGQVCIAPDYLLVERAVREPLLERLVTTMARFRSAAPTPGMRIVNERHFDRLAGQLAATRATVVAGGGVDRSTLTVEPTVLVDPPADDPLMTDEIFGPVLPVLAVDSVDEAIDFVAERPKPLAAYVFTRSKEVRRRVLDEVTAGAIVVNHLIYHASVPQLPFGGVGPSGMGRYRGRDGFVTFSNRKAVLVKPFRPDFRFAYPPYTDRAQAMIRRLF
ncbi:aldehyde dehydrogenase family protein [Rhodococcus sp. NPDC058505]|uniref:aldehyde dehydrogenase family protein n=1 Tax=Rhodococcus sp. NPDC058505 TaxID=3346531 RepID=UPI003646CC4D